MPPILTTSEGSKTPERRDPAEHHGSSVSSEPIPNGDASNSRSLPNGDAPHDIPATPPMMTHSEDIGITIPAEPAGTDLVSPPGPRADFRSPVSNQPPQSFFPAPSLVAQAETLTAPAPAPAPASAATLGLGPAPTPDPASTSTRRISTSRRHSRTRSLPTRSKLPEPWMENDGVTAEEKVEPQVQLEETSFDPTSRPTETTKSVRFTQEKQSQSQSTSGTNPVRSSNARKTRRPFHSESSTSSSILVALGVVVGIAIGVFLKRRN